MGAVEDFLKSKKNMEKMFSNNEYINWLTNFTNKYPNFVGEKWIHDWEKISTEDKENVCKLNLLFAGIQSYADKDYINSKHVNFGEYYSIKNNNVGFNIGVCAGQGAFFYCEKVTPDEKFIEYNDIANKTVQPRTLIIDYKLELLSQKIKELIDLGVPRNKIENLIIKNENEYQKTKKLIKR